MRQCLLILVLNVKIRQDLIVQQFLVDQVVEIIL